MQPAHCTISASAHDCLSYIGRFVELKEVGVKPDLVTYNTLLKACMRSANLPCAEVIMTQLRQQGLQVCPLQFPVLDNMHHSSGMPYVVCSGTCEPDLHCVSQRVSWKSESVEGSVLSRPLLFCPAMSRVVMAVLAQAGQRGYSS